MTGISAAQYGDSLSERVYRLEVMVDYLSQKMDELLDVLESNAGLTQKNNLWIEELDDLFCVIKLSNGSKFTYSSFSGQNIAHWLTNQPVRLDAAKKRGCVKIVNLETGDWIEAEKSLF